MKITEMRFVDLTLMSGEKERLERRVGALPVIQPGVCVDFGQLNRGVSATCISRFRHRIIRVLHERVRSLKVFAEAYESLPYRIDTDRVSAVV